MAVAARQTIASEPRWNGRSVLFEIRDGERSIACAISVNALQDLTGQRRFKPADLLACFAGARRRIEAMALAKALARGGDATGVLHLWSDDIDEKPAAEVAHAA